MVISSIRDYFFLVLIFIVWNISMLVPSGFLPILILLNILFCINFINPKNFQLKFDTENLFLIFFFIGLLILSFYHGELLLQTGIFLFLGFFLRSNNKAIPSLHFFIITQILIGVILFRFFDSIFSLFFWDSYSGRTSIHPLVSSSLSSFICSIGLLDLIIKKRTNLFLYAIYIYFIVFSLQRTFYLFWLIYIFVEFFKINKLRFAYILLISVPIAFLFLNIVFSQIEVNNLVLTMLRIENIDQFESIRRIQDFNHLVSAWQSDIIFGTGNSFTDFLEIKKAGEGSPGSEIVFIKLFAQFGVFASFVYFFFLVKIKRIIKQHNYKHSYYLFMLYLICFFFYSSFLYTYNFFVLYLFLLLSQKKAYAVN